MRSTLLEKVQKAVLLLWSAAQRLRSLCSFQLSALTTPRERCPLPGLRRMLGSVPIAESFHQWEAQEKQREAQDTCPASTTCLWARQPVSCQLELRHRATPAARAHVRKSSLWAVLLPPRAAGGVFPFQKRSSKNAQPRSLLGRMCAG